MRYRQKVTKKRSKKVFRRTASRTHKKNLGTSPMRGGIRL